MTELPLWMWVSIYSATVCIILQGWWSHLQDKEIKVLQKRVTELEWTLDAKDRPLQPCSLLFRELAEEMREVGRRLKLLNNKGHY